MCRPIWVSAIKLRIIISFSHLTVQFDMCLIQCGGLWCLKQSLPYINKCYRLYTLAWWRPFQNTQLATFANFRIAFYLALGCQGEWKKCRMKFGGKVLHWKWCYFVSQTLLCNIYLLDRYFQNLFWLQEIALYFLFLWCFFQEDRSRNNPIKWKQTRTSNLLNPQS